MNNVVVHQSQRPERIYQELLRCLRARELNHKFLYDGPEQTRRWLALHQAYSPSRTDDQCAAAYDQAFQAVAQRLPAGPVHVVGLGCGGGQKDTRLLQRLRRSAPVFYTPVDVSESMVRTAGQFAREAEREALVSSGIVADLAQISAEDLLECIEPQARSARKVVTFFGIVPNFEPHAALTLLQNLLTPSDLLLLSANLIPETEQKAALERTLPLYDNVLTRSWLTGFLESVGIRTEHGQLGFTIEPDPIEPAIQRIAAYFNFGQTARLEIGSETVLFETGTRLRVFFSYRHTIQGLGRLLEERGLRVRHSWVTPKQDEGVLLVSSAC